MLNTVTCTRSVLKSLLPTGRKTMEMNIFRTHRDSITVARIFQVKIQIGIRERAERMHSVKLIMRFA